MKYRNEQLLMNLVGRLCEAHEKIGEARQVERDWDGLQQQVRVARRTCDDYLAVIKKQEEQLSG